MTPGGHHAARARREGAGLDRARRAADRPPRRARRSTRGCSRPRAPTRWSRSSRRSTFETQLSGDGHYLFIRPDRILAPRHRLPRPRPAASGRRRRRAGGFDDTLRFHTEPSRGELGACGRGATEVGALTHQPPGAAAALAAAQRQPDRLRLLRPDRGHAVAVEARRRRRGPDPALGDRRAAQPARGPRGRPARQLRLPARGHLPARPGEPERQRAQPPVQLRPGADPQLRLPGRASTAGGSFRPGASLYGQVTCADVPNYSAYLYVAGVCNAADTLAASGTFLSEGYDARGARQPAPARPRHRGRRARAARPRPRTARLAATLRLARGRPLPGRPPPGLDPARRPRPPARR